MECTADDFFVTRGALDQVVRACVRARRALSARSATMTTHAVRRWRRSGRCSPRRAAVNVRSRTFSSRACSCACGAAFKSRVVAVAVVLSHNACSKRTHQHAAHKTHPSNTPRTQTTHSNTPHTQSTQHSSHAHHAFAQPAFRLTSFLGTGSCCASADTRPDQASVRVCVA